MYAVNGPGGSIDTIPARNVYPTAPGPSLGAQADGMSPFNHTGRRYPDMSMTVGGGTATEVDAAEDDSRHDGLFGKPAGWWITLAALLVGLMFAARKLGQESEYANLRLSTYNIVIISLAAIVGISFAQAVLSRFPVPGLTDLVRAV